MEGAPRDNLAKNPGYMAQRSSAVQYGAEIFNAVNRIGNYAAQQTARIKRAWRIIWAPICTRSLIFEREEYVVARVSTSDINTKECVEIK